jgi:hypothetical protein
MGKATVVDRLFNNVLDRDIIYLCLKQSISDLRISQYRAAEFVKLVSISGELLLFRKGRQRTNL